MKNLPKEKFVNTAGLIKQLEAKVASLEQQIKDLQERTTRKDVATPPNITSYNGASPAIAARNGIARYVDVKLTQFTYEDGERKAPLMSLDADKNSIVWDETAGCFKFYGVYKE